MEDRKESINIKDLGLSIGLIKMNSIVLLFFVFIVATAEDGIEAFIAATVLFMMMFIAALYQTFAMDIGINDTKLFKIIRITTGVLTAIGVVTWLLVSGIAVPEMSLQFICGGVAVVAAVIFIVNIGAQALVMSAYIFAPDYKKEE